MRSVHYTSTLRTVSMNVECSVQRQWVASLLLLLTSSPLVWIDCSSRLFVACRRRRQLCDLPKSGFHQWPFHRREVAVHTQSLQLSIYIEAKAQRRGSEKSKRVLSTLSDHWHCRLHSQHSPQRKIVLSCSSRSTT